jgi:hypothetical protein
VLRNRYFYLLALGSFASVGAVGGMNANLKLLLKLDQHRGQSEAYRIIAVVAAVSLARPLRRRLAGGQGGSQAGDAGGLLAGAHGGPAPRVGAPPATASTSSRWCSGWGWAAST